MNFLFTKIKIAAEVENSGELLWTFFSFQNQKILDFSNLTSKFDFNVSLKRYIKKIGFYQ
jgi:hypothetical protein